MRFREYYSKSGRNIIQKTVEAFGFGGEFRGADLLQVLSQNHQMNNIHGILLHESLQIHALDLLHLSAEGVREGRVSGLWFAIDFALRAVAVDVNSTPMIEEVCDPIEHILSCLQYGLYIRVLHGRDV